VVPNVANQQAQVRVRQNGRCLTGAKDMKNLLFHADLKSTIDTFGRSKSCILQKMHSRKGYPHY